MTITITHDAERTTADGTTRGDHAGQILKRAGGFMWSRNTNAWVLNRTWHYATRDQKVRAAVAALEAAGIPVTVERDDQPAVTTAADVAAQEADRAARADRRADYFERKAERTAAEADAGFARARELASIIPLGQPILIGHHSESRDRNYRAKINRTDDRALAAHKESEDAARRAQSAATSQAHRESMPATLKRIGRLETEARDLGRRIAGASTPEYAERIGVMATENAAQLAYWRQHVADLEAAGVKVWTRTDFKPGDYALCRGRWLRVVKVNPKTLHLDTGHMPWPLPYAYADVAGHRPACIWRPGSSEADPCGAVATWWAWWTQDADPVCDACLPEFTTAAAPDRARCFDHRDPTPITP